MVYIQAYRRSIRDLEAEYKNTYCQVVNEHRFRLTLNGQNNTANRIVLAKQSVHLHLQ